MSTRPPVARVSVRCSPATPSSMPSPTAWWSPTNAVGSSTRIGATGVSTNINASGVSTDISATSSSTRISVTADLQEISLVAGGLHLRVDQSVEGELTDLGARVVSALWAIV